MARTAKTAKTAKKGATPITAKPEKNPAEVEAKRASRISKLVDNLEGATFIVEDSGLVTVYEANNTRVAVTPKNSKSAAVVNIFTDMNNLPSATFELPSLRTIVQLAALVKGKSDRVGYGACRLCKTRVPKVELVRGICAQCFDKTYGTLVEAADFQNGKKIMFAWKGAITVGYVIRIDKDKNQIILFGNKPHAAGVDEVVMSLKKAVEVVQVI